MLNKQAIYHKTAKGAEAIANRHSGLPPKLRSLLIMVDGKRSYSDLSGVAAALGDSEALLSQLTDAGLIEPVSAAVPAAAAAAQVDATTPAGLAPVSLPEARRFASHLLLDILGPTAEVLCMKIEAAHNLAEFVAAVKRARDIVRDVKGEHAAERFVAGVEAHAPQSS
jgi:hypothetical protein